MGLAAIYGWTVILGGTALACVAWVFVLRLAAAAGNASVQAAWIAAAAAIAGTAVVSVACRIADFRVATSHERPLPWMVVVAVVASAALAWALPRLVADPARPRHDAAMRSLCIACVVAPLAAWTLGVQVPALRAADRNRIRGEYDEAVTEGDAARVSRLLAENAFLRDEIEHALDGTVRANDEDR